MNPENNHHNKTPLHLKLAEAIGYRGSMLVYRALETSIVVSITIGLLKLAGII